MKGPRYATRSVGDFDGLSGPSLALAQLRWRLMAYQNSAIHRVEYCIAGVAALRWYLNDPDLDRVVDGFRSVRADLGAIDPEGLIRLDEIQALADRLVALQAELARFGVVGGRIPAERQDGIAITPPFAVNDSGIEEAGSSAETACAPEYRGPEDSR